MGRLGRGWLDWHIVGISIIYNSRSFTPNVLNPQHPSQLILAIEHRLQSFHYGPFSGAALRSDKSDKCFRLGYQRVTVQTGLKMLVSVPFRA